MVLRLRRVDPVRPEHVRMAPDQLVANARNHIAEIERAALLRHPRVVDHLQKQVAQFVPEAFQVPPRDRVHDFVGFLQRVRGDALKRLPEVPDAPAVRVPKPRHDF